MSLGGVKGKEESPDKKNCRILFALENYGLEMFFIM
jgi:hypothetical protein